MSCTRFLDCNEKNRPPLFINEKGKGNVKKQTAFVQLYSRGSSIYLAGRQIFGNNVIIFIIIIISKI